MTRRTDKVDISPAGQAQLDAQRQRLAYRNGKAARAAGRPVADSNPYPRARQSHYDFIAGWHGR